MERMIKYLMEKFKISEQDARETLNELDVERRISSAEKILWNHGLGKLAQNTSEQKLEYLGSIYDYTAEENTEEIEEKIIEHVFGKSIAELKK